MKPYSNLAILLLLAALCQLSGCDKPDTPKRQETAHVPDVPAQPNTPQPSNTSSTGATLDLAKERAAFHTKLTSHGPSPQPFETQAPPAGAREITYPSGELKLKAWISQPPAGTQKRRAIVYCHGGFSFGADDWQQSKPYRDAGYIVMMPMLRGENGNPGEFEMFYSEVDDAINAGKYLATVEGVDASHLFIAGHSAGGTIATLASLEPTPFAAAASFGGTMNMASFVASPKWRTITPFDPNDQTEIRLRSSKPFIQSIRCPLLMIAGAQDPYAAREIKAVQAEQLKTEKELTTAIVAGDHFSSVDDSIRRSIAFFTKVAP